MKNDIMIDKTHKNIIIINGTLKLKGMDYVILFPPYNFNFYKSRAINLKQIKYYRTSGTLLLKVL